MFTRIPGDRRGRSLSLQRAMVLTLTALLIMAILTPPARAGDDKGAGVLHSGERVNLAGGVWLEETDTTFSELTVRIFDLASHSTWSGNVNYKDPSVVLFYTRRVLDVESNIITRTEYEGFAALPGATFTFQRALKDARADLDVVMYGYECVESAGGGGQGFSDYCYEIDEVTVSVDLTWTGVGDIYRDTFGDSLQGIPGFKFHSRTVEASRLANLTGIVAGDGVVLGEGAADFALLLRGMYQEQIVVKG